MASLIRNTVGYTSHSESTEKFTLELSSKFKNVDNDLIEIKISADQMQVEKTKPNLMCASESEHLLSVRQAIIDSLEMDNKKLREKITVICKNNEENLRQIEELKMQLIDCRNMKKYADFNKITTRKLIGIENELNTLREKNTDLIHRNFCLTFEKNELYNLIKILENKIQNSNRDIERLTAMNAEKKHLTGESSVNASQHQTICVNEANCVRTGYESEKANLIRQVEFYKNKLFLVESNLQKKDKEIENLKENLLKLSNKMEMDQLEFQAKYDEVNNYHKNKIKELYEIWKKDYTSLEYGKKLTENDLLNLKEKYSKLENTLLECQKQTRSVDDIRTKYETLQIKYDTDKIKYVKQQSEFSENKQKDLIILRDDLKKSEERKNLLEDKLSKIQSILNLETKKNEHLRDKCRDYWTLLTAKDDQLKLAQRTVEKQIIERQKLLKEIEFYKNVCIENGVNILSDANDKSISSLSSIEFLSKDCIDLKPHVSDITIQQLYKNTTFQSLSKLDQVNRQKSKLSIIEQLTSLSNSSGSTATLTEDVNFVDNCTNKGVKNSPSSSKFINEYTNLGVATNIITENVKDFTIAKNSSMKKRQKKT